MQPGLNRTKLRNSQCSSRFQFSGSCQQGNDNGLVRFWAGGYIPTRIWPPFQSTGIFIAASIEGYGRYRSDCIFGKTSVCT